jgi:transposase InsO family protein
MPKRPAEPDVIERWKIFLRNHRHGTAAMDFFTVPTVTFNVLYILFVIHHARRQILHFNVTTHPASEWVVQQLREAFPYEAAPRYLIFDRDGKYGPSVVAAIKAMGIKPSRTAFRSPWQNGVAERWIGLVRREMLNQVVVFNERHLRRLLRDYVTYYRVDRTHLGLRKDSPSGRPLTPKPSQKAKVVSLPRIGGLHHRYKWREAA